MKARKRFGQHFLEAAWVRKLVEVVDPHAGEVFLEIGPGYGALTRPLALRSGHVVAIEIDRDLGGELRRTAPPNVEVVVGDFLAADVRALFSGRKPPFRAVGNLPYNISSPILFRLLSLSDNGTFLSDATLMLQREVADRLVAKAGTREYGVLSVMVQIRAAVARMLVLPRGAFRPVPGVSSAVVRLAFGPPRVPVGDPAVFEAMVRALFAHRRKTAANALGAFAEEQGQSAKGVLALAGVDPRRRPETLELAELARIASLFASAAPPDVL
jgi:16S rRNA (adenine1518-N6/adenine1519-N6)-dimethyltransferase